jgi:hypothetical protein
MLPKTPYRVMTDKNQNEHNRSAQRNSDQVRLVFEIDPSRCGIEGKMRATPAKFQSTVQHGKSAAARAVCVCNWKRPISVVAQFFTSYCVFRATQP